jgi:hypothetical protein
VPRGIAFFVLLAIIWGMPLCRHILKLKHPVFQGWGMFGSAGLRARQVEFRRDDGSGPTIDRYALLVPAGQPVPAKLRYLKDVQEVRQVGRELCRALGADARVVAHFRIATIRGWQAVMAGEEDLCVP